jgi:hypothetical protein
VAPARHDDDERLFGQYAVGEVAVHLIGEEPHERHVEFARTHLIGHVAAAGCR